MNFNEIVNDAKKLADEHPEQAKEALDKAEGIVNERTGNKYTDQVTKGEDAVEGQLGLPADKPMSQ
jgi:hypothetical protein